MATSIATTKVSKKNVDAVVKAMMEKIEDHDLMTDELKEVLTGSLSVTKSKKEKNKPNDYQRLVGGLISLMKQLFPTIHYRLRFKVAVSMASIMHKNPEISQMQAMDISMRKVNDEIGDILFANHASTSNVNPVITTTIPHTRLKEESLLVGTSSCEDNKEKFMEHELMERCMEYMKEKHPNVKYAYKRQAAGYMKTFLKKNKNCGMIDAYENAIKRVNDKNLGEKVF